MVKTVFFDPLLLGVIKSDLKLYSVIHVAVNQYIHTCLNLFRMSFIRLML
jgi:hypothetical protein